MNPDLLSNFVTESIPPELVTLAIVLGGLSGTFFFVWGIISPLIKWLRDSTFQLSFREIEVHIADPDYYKFNLWLNTNRENTYFQRSFKVINNFGSLEEYDDLPDDATQDQMKAALVPGFGSVLIKAPGMPFVWVMRTKEESKQVFKQTETLRFRIFSFRQTKVDHFFEEITKIRQSTGPKVYSGQGSSHSYWSESGIPKHVLPPLGASSIELVEDVGKFLDNREEYKRRGIPYKRGYMLAGPPGTGKSSDVAYLSQLYGMNVYQLSSESISKFDGLRTQIRPGSIVLIEDIDMTVAGVGRKKVMSKDDPKPDTENQMQDVVAQIISSETMREFLNALDGICEFEGSIIIVTTNKPQSLDPALLRPGRIDRTIVVGAYTSEEQIAHINRFYNTNLQHKEFAHLEPKTVAEIQYLCTSNMDDVDAVLKQL